MARLPLPDEESASPALADEYAAAREREGVVMAILRAMGPRAEVVQAFLAMTEAVLYGPAALGRREREVLALATSEANGAGYSAGVHATLLEELGGRREGDDALRRVRATRHAGARRVGRGGRRRCDRRSPTPRSTTRSRSSPSSTSPTARRWRPAITTADDLP